MFCSVCCPDRCNSAQSSEKHLVVYHVDLDTFPEHLLVSGSQQTADASAPLVSRFILNVGSVAQAEDFIANEPFNKAGTFEKMVIHRMRTGRRSPDLADRH